MTQGATFKQRNGYDLHEFVERSIAHGQVPRLAAGDENEATVGHAVVEATGRQRDGNGTSVAGDDVVVLASGNLGLIYFMEERRRLCMEEIDERHPQLLDALRSLVGAAAVHDLLTCWRRSLQGQPPTVTVAEGRSESVRR